MKKFLLIPLLLQLLPVQADEALIAKILQLPPNTGGQIVYFNDFTEKSKLPNFRYVNQFSFSPTGGENGSPAIKCEKTDPAKLQDLRIQLPVLPGGRTYTTETMIRAENVKFSGTGIASVSLELRQNNRRIPGGLYSVFRKKDYVPGKWFLLKANFSINGENIAPRYSIYMMPHTTGTFYISSLCIKTAGNNSSILLRKPYNMTLDPAGTAVEFSVNGVPENAKMVISISAGGQQKHLLISGKNGIYNANIPALPPGKARLTIRATNAQGTELFCQSDYNFTVRKLAEPSYAVMPDKYQRITVNGKPFMPIGLYGYKASTDKDLQKISAAGFNCYIDYNSPAWGNRTGNIAGFRAMLDNYARFGLKCIFNIRWQSPYTGNSLNKNSSTDTIDGVTTDIVSKLADHPALLAWYVSDETTRINIPQIVHLREVISAADPYHPTFGTSCYSADLPLFGNAADIIGVDPYPIGNSSSATRNRQSLSGMFNLINGVRNNGQIMWIVSQAFSWGGYRAASAAKFNNWRHPTADEIKAMPLLAALCGAKGFIFYSYRPKGWNFSAEYEALRWRALCESVKELKLLEKFIISRQPVKIIAQNKDFICGMFTADDSKRAVVLVGINPGAAGKITLPAERWQHVSGAAEIKANELTFDFKNISSAILLER